jgi:hypothetical protein
MLDLPYRAQSLRPPHILLVQDIAVEPLLFS